MFESLAIPWKPRVSIEKLKNVDLDGRTHNLSTIQTQRDIIFVALHDQQKSQHTHINNNSLSFDAIVLEKEQTFENVASNKKLSFHC